MGEDQDTLPVAQSLKDWHREVALEEVASLKELRAIGWEQHNQSFKWLTATLLALNGGGLLAVSQIEQIPVLSTVSAGTAFAAGIAFALLVAVIAQRAIVQSFTPIQRQIGYWMTVASDGCRDDTIENDLQEGSKKVLPWNRATQVLGWLAAIAFFVGIFMAGSGLLEAARTRPTVPIEASLSK